MSTPVALVTGTSTGIGRSTAMGLARAGYTVVATTRAERDAALRAAAAEAGVTLDIRTLDVTDLDAAQDLVARVAEDHGRLDLLVNNAGRGQVGTLEQLTLGELHDTMAVNFTAVAALTQAAMPHLRAARGRVVTISSVGGAVGQPFNDAYCAAKFAVEGLMQSLAPVAAAHGVDVCIVEPGPVATEFVANVGRADSRSGDDDPYAPQLAAYAQRTAGAFAAAQTADEVAAVVIDVATAEKPAFRTQTSERARAFAGMSLADLDGAGVIGATSSWIG